LFIKCQYSKIAKKSVLKIYNVSGCLLEEFPIRNEIMWDGKDKMGYTVPPGIYFLKSDGKSVGKVVKVR